MLIVELCDRRHLNLAPSRHRAATTRMKRAAARSFEGAGDRSLDRNQTLSGGLAQTWDCPQKIHSVWVLGVAEDLAHGSVFDYLTEIHDGNGVSDLCDHTQIMGDKHNRHAQAFL